MAEDDDDSQKTEEPSEKRLRDALEKGQVIHSKELTNFVVLLVSTICIVALLSFAAKKVTIFSSVILENADQFSFNSHVLYKFSLKIVLFISALLIVPYIFILFAAIIANFIQSGTFVISLEPIKPKFSKISIVGGLKRLFSMGSILEFFKGVVKMIIVAAALYFAISPYFSKITDLYLLDVGAVIKLIMKLIMIILIISCIILFFIGALDYFYQRFMYYKNLRMSKQEVKEEYKQLEGSPEIKSKLKQLRSQRAKQRMMQAIPDADVVITNPTHFSVALKYDPSTMRAPKLIGKGQDFIALAIRKLATEKNIPIVENPPLARGLYQNIEIDQEITIEYYKAVAEVINYVYKLKNK